VHDWHAVAGLESWSEEPAAHRREEAKQLPVLPCGTKYPGVEHTSHGVEEFESVSIVPATQVAHTVEREAANDPALQVAQAVAGFESVSAVPARHENDRQVPVEPEGVNSPALQLMQGVDARPSSSIIPAEQLNLARQSPNEIEGV
jgi:hypothetical protein